MDTKKELAFEEAIWERVASVIKKRAIKQAWLIRRCEEVGMPISQPELSKLYNRKKKINIYEVTAISKALDVPVDFFILGNQVNKEVFFDTSKTDKLTGNLESGQLDAYLGDFHIYYNITTDDYSGVKQGGTMSITDEENGYCSVEVKIYTGEYLNNKEIVKKYEGRILVTIILSGAYVILRNDNLGELCFMILRHRTFSVKQLECRLAMCLTISSGESKLPTVHKMLITRTPLKEEQLEMAGAYLDLYNKTIRIKKSKAHELIDCMRNDKEKQSLRRLWQMLPETEYYEVSIELLRQSLQLSRYDFAVFIAKFLENAETEPYAKVYENDDNLVYALLDSKLMIKTTKSPPSF